jgi:hypothetical protein
MNNNTLSTTTTADSDLRTNSDALMDAIIERELQQQQRLRRQMNIFMHRNEMRRRRRQTAVVATLVNITSVAALLFIALVWQFYFPLAQAVASILP